MTETREQARENPGGRSLRSLPVHIAWANTAYARALQKREDGKALIAAMLTGIKLYQDHPFRRTMPPLPVVWADGAAQLFYCAATTAPRAAVFIVPSMINGSAILDLLPEKSFIRALSAQGADVYLFDWGAPAADPGMADMTGAITTRLIPALQAAQKQARAPFYALGYCMGGTLLAGALAHAQTGMAGAAFLASPWDFHAGDRALTAQVQAGTPAALQAMSRRNVLPVDWIQSVFAAVNEDRTAHKFARFAAMDQASAEARLFVAVEDWLNEGHDLPASLARTCLCDWYGENRPGQGAWTVDGTPVYGRNITVRSLVVAPARDRLVPADSALAFARELPAVTIMRPDCGHIGMMTGRSAADAVWNPVADWIFAAQQKP